MTGFIWFSKVFAPLSVGRKCPFGESSLSIERANRHSIPISDLFPQVSRKNVGKIIIFFRTFLKKMCWKIFFLCVSHVCSFVDLRKTSLIILFSYTPRVNTVSCMSRIRWCVNSLRQADIIKDFHRFSHFCRCSIFACRGASLVL